MVAPSFHTDEARPALDGELGAGEELWACPDLMDRLLTQLSPRCEELSHNPSG